MSVEDGCPICNSSQSAKERFATARVAEHLKGKTRHDGAHRDWFLTYEQSVRFFTALSLPMPEIPVPVVGAIEPGVATSVLADRASRVGAVSSHRS